MEPPDAAEAARKKKRHRNERLIAIFVIAVVAAGAWMAIRWNERERARLAADRSYLPGSTVITPEILMLQEYVRIDTSAPAGVMEGARWLVRKFEERGIQAEVIESAPGRANVYARVRGRAGGEGLMLLNHIDVFPAGEGWSHPPFSGDIAINALWGRGAIDVKALAVTQLLAMADAAAAATPPAHDLVFLATADEESGSRWGMQWLLEHRPDVFANVAYCLAEGGVTEIMSEKMTYFGIEVGGKQLVELTLEGDSEESLTRARIALEPFMLAREPERILPSVRKYFQQIAPTRAAFGPLLADIDASVEKGIFWSLPAPYRDLTVNSMWVEVPRRREDRWSMLVKMVNLPDEIPARRISWLESVVRPFGARLGEVRSSEGPVPLSPDTTKLFDILAAEAVRRYQTTAGAQIGYKSVSDARFLRPRGIVCYGVSPYPVDFYQSLTIHRMDERIGLDRFLDGVGYMRNVVAEWGATQPGSLTARQ